MSNSKGSILYLSNTDKACFIQEILDRRIDKMTTIQISKLERLIEKLKKS